ncbi:hypothetical protein D3C78_1378050 [compost metagenome]
MFSGNSASPLACNAVNPELPHDASICLAANAATAALKSRLMTFRSFSLRPWLASAASNDNCVAVPRKIATRLPLRSCKVLIPEPGTTPKYCFTPRALALSKRVSRPLDLPMIAARSPRYARST